MLHLCPPKNRMAAWDFEVGSVLVGFKPFSIIHQKWWQLSLHSSLFQGVWTHWTAQKNCWSCLGPFWRCKHESIVIAHWFDLIAMILLMHNGDAKHRHQIQFPNADRSAHSTNLLGFHFWMVRFSNDMMETKKTEVIHDWWSLTSPWWTCLQQNGETPRS